MIARTRTEVDAIASLVEQTFDVDAENSLSHNERLQPSEFGYRSVHYIVSIPRDVDLGEGNDDLHELEAEVQLRTVAEHTSADFDHDYSYKGAFTLPDRWRHELAMIAAQVETIDQAFVRIEDGLRVYASTYGAYLDPYRLRREIAELRVMCSYSADDPILTTRLARLLRQSGELEDATDAGRLLRAPSGAVRESRTRPVTRSADARSRRCAVRLLYARIERRRARAWPFAPRACGERAPPTG